MLTRLEVNGFKNLVDFALDFGPFTCIFGPNGAGKSNMFDAIRFLSLLTKLTINEAAFQVRDGGDLAGLFFGEPSQRCNRMAFGVEMIVGPSVKDDFGRDAEPSSSFLRYEVAFRYEPSAPASGRLGGLVLEHEELRPITAGTSARHLRFPHSKGQFRDSVVYNRRHARSGFISTGADPETNEPSVTVHQDGGAQGWGRSAPAEGAVRTIVGMENTTATPTILAARREMQSWLVLDLDPAGIRKPDRYTQKPGIGRAGEHIPATLQHAARGIDCDESTPDDVPAGLSERLSRLAPVHGLRLVRDDTQRLLSLEVEEDDGRRLPVDLLSDSALRSLALATLASAPNEGSLICVEEPDQGIFPTNLGAMNDLLHEIAVNPEEPVSADNTLRQVIITSHSPSLIQQQERADLVWVESANRLSGSSGSVGRALRCVPHRGAWRCADDRDGFDLDALEPFGTRQQDGQIAFPSEVWETA